MVEAGSAPIDDGATYLMMLVPFADARGGPDTWSTLSTAAAIPIEGGVLATP